METSSLLGLNTYCETIDGSEKSPIQEAFSMMFGQKFAAPPEFYGIVESCQECSNDPCTCRTELKIVPSEVARNHNTPFGQVVAILAEEVNKSNNKDVLRILLACTSLHNSKNADEVIDELLLVTEFIQPNEEKITAEIKPHLFELLSNIFQENRYFLSRDQNRISSPEQINKLWQIYENFFRSNCSLPERRGARRRLNKELWSQDISLLWFDKSTHRRLLFSLMMKHIQLIGRIIESEEFEQNIEFGYYNFDDLIGECLVKETNPFSLAELWFMKGQLNARRRDKPPRNDYDISIQCFESALDILYGDDVGLPVEPRSEREASRHSFSPVNLGLQVSRELEGLLAKTGADPSREWQLLLRQKHWNLGTNHRMKVNLANIEQRMADWYKKYESNKEEELVHLQRAFEISPVERKNIVLNKIIQWHEEHSDDEEKIMDLYNETLRFTSKQENKISSAKAYNKWFNYIDNKKNVDFDSHEFTTNINLVYKGVTQTKIKSFKMNFDKFIDKYELSNKLLSGQNYNLKDWFEKLEKPISIEGFQKTSVTKKELHLMYKFLTDMNEKRLPVRLLLTSSPSTNHYSIIDGIQRFMLIIMGLAVIRNMMEERADSGGYIARDNNFSEATILNKEANKINDTYFFKHFEGHNSNETLINIESKPLKEILFMPYDNYRDLSAVEESIFYTIYKSISSTIDRNIATETDPDFSKEIIDLLDAIESIDLHIIIIEDNDGSDQA